MGDEVETINHHRPPITRTIFVPVRDNYRVIGKLPLAVNFSMASRTGPDGWSPPPRKDSARQATLLSRFPLQTLKRRVQYVAETPGIRKDPSRRQIDIKPPAIGCPRCHLANAVGRIHSPRCRGVLRWE